MSCKNGGKDIGLWVQSTASSCDVESCAIACNCDVSGLTRWA